MPRTPLTTPTIGSTSWGAAGQQLFNEHEALFGATPGVLEATTQAQVRANIGAGTIVQMTQAAYTALGTKDPNTLYVIVG